MVELASMTPGGRGEGCWDIPVSVSSDKVAPNPTKLDRAARLWHNTLGMGVM